MKKRQNFLLVIGIDVYKSADWPDLNNAVSDAKAITALLTEKYGFELLDEPLYNQQATRENISQLFANAVNQLMPGDNLIVYFAGHGFMNPQTHKGYWVPHEAELRPTDMISNSEIKDFIEVLPAQHILLIADSCFSGTFITRNRGRLENLTYEQLDNKKSRWVLTSGHEEKVSDGAQGGDSPFARYLKRFLTENKNAFASVAELIRYVCAMTASVSKQSPQGASITNVGHEEGQLIFLLNAEHIVTKVGSTDSNPVTPILRTELRAVYQKKSHYSGGKEIVLIDMLDDPKSLVMIENFRFDDEGQRKLVFRDGAVEMGSDEDKSIFPVYVRAATWEGMDRYLGENESKFKDIKIVLWPAHESINDVESTATAISQQEFIQDMIDQNQHYMECLHCGKMISTNDSYTVEIDEEGLKPNAGNVHQECLRPVDRIIGRAMLPGATDTKLINFDYAKWLELLKTGQGFVRGAIRVAGQRAGAMISWNKSHQHQAGDFCIKMISSDGSSSYLKIGKDLHRFTAAEIDAELAEMDGHKGEFGMLTKTQTFGDVDYLETIKTTGDEVLPITEFVKARYSNQLAVAETSLANDYAPLGLLQDTEGKTISFGKFIPLVSDPSTFDELYKNWNACGLIDGPCTLHIIENDKEVDFYLMGFFSDGMIPVLNPKFDPDMTLLAGLTIRDIKEIISSKGNLGRNAD